MRFAIMEVKVAICKLLMNFRLDVADDTPVSRANYKTLPCAASMLYGVMEACTCLAQLAFVTVVKESKAK